MITADLHIHTNFSDGLNSPEEILEIVKEKQLKVFSISDHDNIGGYLYLNKILNEDDPELIPGVELSAGQGAEDIHILGYFFDPSSDELNSALRLFRDKRNQRGVDMLNKLKEQGINIPHELVKEFAGLSAIGRPNVADAMVKVKAVNSFAEAFDKYIGYSCPAYVPKHNITPKEAIELIHRAEGLAILAHPGIAGAGSHIDEFLSYGIDGIEVYHPMHNSRLQKSYKDFAEKKDILITGGSDFHGRQGKHGQIGSMSIPDNTLTLMKERLSLLNRG